MKDLFGNEVTKVKPQKKKIHVATKKEVVNEKIDSNCIGLNSIWKDFGNYIINDRGNKTP